MVASSISMMGMSSFTAYTRWHCVHFRLSGFWRYSSACLQAGQTRISSNPLESMRALYARIFLAEVLRYAENIRLLNAS